MGNDEFALFVRQKLEEVEKQAGFTSWPVVQWSQLLPIQVFPTRPTIDITPKFRDENNLSSYPPTTLPIV